MIFFNKRASNLLIILVCLLALFVFCQVADAAFTKVNHTEVNLASLVSPYNFTATKPTNTVEEQIMFTHIMFTGDRTIDSVPSGWGDCAGSSNPVASNTSQVGYDFYLYCKVAGASEPSSWVWSLTGSAKVRAVVITYTAGEFEPTDIIDVISNTAYTTSNTTVRGASMTVSAINSPLVFFGSVYETSGKTFTAPSATATWVEDVDSGHTNPDFWSSIYSMIWTSSGSTGNMDAILSSADTQKHAFVVALNPRLDVPQSYNECFSTQAPYCGNASCPGSEYCYATSAPAPYWTESVASGTVNGNHMRVWNN